MKGRPLSDGALDRLAEAAARPDLEGTKYRLVGTIARGGMGIVYLARDTELRREVALKVLDLPGLDGSVARRMLEEARILARLEHPGIVPVHDVGTLPDGRIFYVMKRVKGRSLDLHEVREAPLAGRLRVVERICEAVGFAHARGVIHRDLKPGNVMVGEFGEVLVMDWGVAKLIEATDPGEGGESGRPEASLETPAGVESGAAEAGALPSPEAGEEATLPSPGTAHGAVLGTPAWMAPEQARGEIGRIDARADVYALGAILHFLLTGKPPSGARTAAEAVRFFDGGGASPARRQDRTIPKALDAIRAKAMALDPEERYDDASALGRDIARHLAGLPPAGYREGFLERAGRWFRKYRTFILLVLAYLAMRVALFFWGGR